MPRLARASPCAALGDQNFGRNVFSNSIDPNVLGGWGVRSGDWQIGASIQQEVLSRMSVEVGYFRRWLQNFTVNDNLVMTTANFDPFSVTAPADSRLPGGGGYVVSDLYNVTPSLLRVGRTRTNLGFDVYNLFNSSAVLTYNQTFIPGGSWLTPLTVLTPRFVKISAQVDF